MVLDLKCAMPTRINKEFLLSHNSQETYMEYYLGIPVKRGLVKSPLRKDKSPTCSFYVSKSGDLIFKDFSGDFQGNFLEVVRYLYSCDYYKACRIVANDFGLCQDNSLVKNKKPITISPNKLERSDFSNIQIQIKAFTEDELKWWASFGISEDILKFYNVYSCAAVFLNSELFTLVDKKDPAYGYYRGKNAEGYELWRIYFPKRKNFRFISNWSSSMIQGAKQLPQSGDLVVVTKSMKDVMCLKGLGINAVAPNSENLFLSDAQLEKLKSRFNHVVVLYDNDLPGLHGMQKIRKTHKGLCCLWIPRKYQAKDVSDFYKKYGREKTIQLINEAKENVLNKRHSQS